MTESERPLAEQQETARQLTALEQRTRRRRKRWLSVATVASFGRPITHSVPLSPAKGSHKPKRKRRRR